MLDKLDSLNWQRLRHAYGAAGDVPALIRALDADTTKARASAMEKLAGALAHQGTLYSASPRALPFVLELVTQGKHADRAQLLRLLVDLTFGSTYAGLSSSSVEPRFEADDGKWAKASYDEMLKALARLSPLLSDKHWEVRAALAYLFGWFPDEATEVAKVLRDQLAHEKDARVRASILFALGRADAALGVKTDDALFAKIVDGGDPVERVAAAAALFYRLGDDLPRSALDTLADAARTAPAVPEFPWDDGNLARLAGRLLGALGPKHEGVAVDALLASLEGNPDGILELLERVFPDGWKYGRKKLTPTQNKVIESIVKSVDLYIKVGEVRLVLEALGFPESPRQLAKVVGCDLPPSPLEASIDVTSDGGTKHLRIGDTLMAIANGDTALKTPFMRAVAKLPIDAQWNIVVHGSSQRGVKEPLHNLLTEVVAEIRKRSEPEFRKKAEELAKNGLPYVLAGDSFMRNAAIYGYFAAVVFDGGDDAPADSGLYDDLAFRSLCGFPFPWMVRRVARLPRARRDAIIAKLKKEDETDSIDAIRDAS